MELTVHTTYRTDYSAKRYEPFASPDDLEEEIVSDLTAEEKEAHNREHIIKANLIYRERVRLGIGKYPDRCPSCRSTMNRVDEKCILCGIDFCVYCVDPKKHNCVVYQYEWEKHSDPVELPEEVAEHTIINEPVNFPEVQVAQLLNDSKEYKLERHLEPVKLPEEVAEHTRIDMSVTSPAVEANQLSNSKEVEIKEKIKKETKEEVKMERKIPLWRRLFSLFGFGN